MVEQFLVLVNGVKLFSITVSVIVDFVLGVIVAIKEGKFEFKKLADFLNTSVLYYLGGYFCIGILALVNPQFELMVAGAFAVIEVSLVAGILAKLKKLGLPIPDVIAR